jgi:hypothetical protein
MVNTTGLDRFLASVIFDDAALGKGSYSAGLHSATLALRPVAEADFGTGYRRSQ